jgi:DNA-binding GntR family transcriptional regulator
LASDGLVELKFNSGASVRRFTRAEVLAFEEAREAIESAAAGIAAERLASSGKDAELEFLVEAMTQAAREGARRTFLALNDRFHDLVLAIADNPVLISFAAQLLTPVIEHQIESFADDSWMTTADREHREILAALRSGEREAAEAATRAHLRRVREVSRSVPDEFFSPARTATAVSIRS